MKIGLQILVGVGAQVFEFAHVDCSDNSLNVQVIRLVNDT